MTAGIVDVAMPGWRDAPASAPFVIGVLPGEGIGPEVVGAALTVLDAAADAYGIDIEVRPAAELGAPGPYGATLRDEVADFFARTFDASGPVLCGAVGGRFVYELRARFDLFCKLVPVLPSTAVLDASIVRAERLTGTDVLLVRENVGGVYLGEFGRTNGGKVAFQHVTYRADQVDRIIDVAVRAAAARRQRLAVVTKGGGIPEISALWRERATVVASGRGVDVDHLEVDNACFQLVADPQRFDVVVAPNLLGDVVADAATLVLGSRGMSYSANFGVDGRAVYQTGHGAAHDLAGRDCANPVGQILSTAMLVRESLRQPEAATAIEQAVERVLASGLRTADIAGPGSTIVGTRALAGAVAEALVHAPARQAAG
jgi:3-isopropylmalate dehydrogenase